MATKKLSRKQQTNLKYERFALLCVHYADQSKAYLDVYPHAKKWKRESVYQNASKLAAKVRPRIQELQQEAKEALLISDHSVLRELKRVAQSDIRNIFDKNGNLIDIHKLDSDTAAAISSIKVVPKKGPNGEIEYVKEVKLWPKNPAQEALSKHLGLFKEDSSKKKLANIKVEVEFVSPGNNNKDSDS